MATKKKPVTPSPDTTGSLVFFYYGNSKFLTTFQETLRLKLAMEGYDYIVLLKYDEIPPLIDISEQDERDADVVDDPTPANVFKYLKQMADDGRMIDLWIFSHGGPGSVADITPSMIKSELSPAKTGFTKVPIRMIWTTACYASTLNEAWSSVGAKAVAGARTVNFFPHQFGKFANEWNKGSVSFRDALTRSDTGVSRAVGDSAMLTHARVTQNQWGGCPGVKTILGDHPCAKQYFNFTWYLADSDFLDSLSGRENMKHGSEKILAGDGALTKSSTPSW
jgi:hypothetical protein